MGALEIVKLFASKDPQICRITLIDAQGWTPLHLAALNNHPYVLKYLLEQVSSWTQSDNDVDDNNDDDDDDNDDNDDDNDDGGGSGGGSGGGGGGGGDDDDDDDDDDDKMEKAAEQDSDEVWRYLQVELQMNKRTLKKLLTKEYSEI